MKIERLSYVIILGFLLVLVFLFLKGRRKDQAGPITTGSGQQAQPTGRQSLSITQIAVDTQNPQVLYVATMNAGIFKSVDRGKSWQAVNEGLKTLMIMDLVIDPDYPQRLFAGTFGGGIYRSDDGGSSWTEANEGLTNTTIPQLVFHPSNLNIVYAVSFGDGVFKSSDHGQTWTAWSEGIQPLGLHSNFVLLPVPVNPLTFFLGTSDGILKRMEGATQWELASGGLSAGLQVKQLTSLAYNPRTKTLFAGVAFQGIFSSQDLGKTWSSLNDGLKNGAVYSLTFDPSNPKVIYAASTTRGVLRSGDDGTTWTEMNNGLPASPAGGEGRSVKTLIRDPHDPQTFYTADLASSGIFVSNNGGGKWLPLDKGFPAIETVTQAFSARMMKEVASLKTSLSPPEALKKCNRCHGWTEPALNMAPRPWRVAPSHRDWDTTVKRMKMMIPDLSASEQAQIIAFLNAHFGVQREK